MLSVDERRKIVAAVSRLAFESTSPETLAQSVIGHLHRLVDAAFSVFYRINEQGHLVPLAGSMLEAGYRYSREYYSLDPLQAAMRDENPWVFRTERNSSAWKEFLDGPVYLDLCRHYDIHSYIHVRLTSTAHGAHGMYGMMLAHGEHQAPFSAQDELDLMELLPALQAAIRRSTRQPGGQGSHLALEATLESARQPTIVLDARGGLLWASKRARRLLGWDRGGNAVVPNALLESALELGALFTGRRTSAGPTRPVQLVGLDGEFVAVNLRVGRTEVGVPVVVAELDLARHPRAVDLAARFKLTAAQAGVLASLTEGCSDKTIAVRHGISIPTVRSHVNQILAKLGVDSRLQAALVAARFTFAFQGPEGEDEDDGPLSQRGNDAERPSDEHSADRSATSP
ncbi:MAG TPA: LuxR C-terminal-related transcriptional regulator [Labilithrix sp.]|nr:LuxR C-terminal-related transcriptional regulator [Labilithrix sp.]